MSATPTPQEILAKWREPSRPGSLSFEKHEESRTFVEQFMMMSEADRFELIMWTLIRLSDR